MTHNDLCQLGATYLLKTNNYMLKCQRVLIDISTSANERPDIFGYMGDKRTLLVEVKISRADFFRDRKKSFRIESKGVGLRRYYLCPENIIKSDDLPPKWGLLYYKNGNVEIVKESEIFDRDCESELQISYSLIRRLTKNKLIQFNNQ